MGKISTQQKIDNYRDMSAMISDYRKLHNRFPTNAEFGEKLGMCKMTVMRYKRIILDEEKIILLKKFQDEMVVRVDDVIKTIDENIVIFKKIRDKSEYEDTKMNAAKNIIDSKLDVIRVMRDGPEFLGIEFENKDDNNTNDNIKENTKENNNDNVSNAKKHFHRKTKPKKVRKK